MKNLAVICLLLLNLDSFFSQSENLSQFDDKLIHFGFALSTIIIALLTKLDIGSKAKLLPLFS